MSLQPIVPLCFPSFGLSLEREEVTMVMEDTAYLELCGAFFFFLKCKTHNKEGKRLISSSRLRERTECTDICIHVNRWGESDRLW